MGESVNGRNKRSAKELIKQAKRIGDEGRNNDSLSSTTTTEPAAGTTTTTTTTGTGGFDKIQVDGQTGEEKLLGLPPVKKQRQGGKRKNAKEEAKEATKEKSIAMFAMLLQTSTASVAMRAGSHWAFTNQECLAIAAPAIEIADQYGWMEKIGESAHFIALGVALAGALTPRVMYTIQIRKDRRVKVHVPKPVQQQSKPVQPRPAGNDADAKQSIRAVGESNGDNPAYVPSDHKQLLAEVVQPL